MGFIVPEGWDRESDTAYVHSSGVSIQLMTYRQREGWCLLPADIDQAVVLFEPTAAGRDRAFEAFAKGVLDRAPNLHTTATGQDSDPDGEEDEDEDDEDT